MRLISFFFQNTPNLMKITETQENIQKKFLVSEISALELVAINSPDSNKNTCNRHTMCYQTVLRAQIWQGPTFSYSLYLKLMVEWYETGSVLIAAAFGTC